METSVLCLHGPFGLELFEFRGQAGLLVNVMGGNEFSKLPFSGKVKALVLPSKSCQKASRLVGRMNAEAGQTGGGLHTMATLQAYQGYLLKDLDLGQGLSPELYWPVHGCYGGDRKTYIACQGSRNLIKLSSLMPMFRPLGRLALLLRWLWTGLDG